jgi:hypothetical protein
VKLKRPAALAADTRKVLFYYLSRQFFHGREAMGDRTAKFGCGNRGIERSGLKKGYIR